MALGIVGVMKSDVITIEDAADPMMPEDVMEEGLALDTTK